MKSLSLIFFILSITCIIVGYMELKILNKKKEKNIEYRVAPKEVIDYQFTPNVTSSFNNLFETQPILP